MQQPDSKPIQERSVRFIREEDRGAIERVRQASCLVTPDPDSAMNRLLELRKWARSIDTSINHPSD